jgi:hypothetical protein
MEAARPSGGPLTLHRLILLSTIYTIDSKAILGRLIQRWSRELTRIDDVVIPCLLLHLNSLPATPPRPVYTSPTPVPRAISETLIHIHLFGSRHNTKRIRVRLSNVVD